MMLVVYSSQRQNKCNQRALQRGFGTVELTLVIIVLGMVIFAGYKLFSGNEGFVETHDELSEMVKEQE
jgi:uncharacterized membrane protein YqhA